MPKIQECQGLIVRMLNLFVIVINEASYNGVKLFEIEIIKEAIHG